MRYVWRLDLMTGYVLLFSSREKAFDYADDVVTMSGEWVRVSKSKRTEEWHFAPAAGRLPGAPIRILRQEVK